MAASGINLTKAEKAQETRRRNREAKAEAVMRDLGAMVDAERKHHAE